MYQAIRIYTLEAGSTEAFQHRVQESFVPLIRQQVGDEAYNARHIDTTGCAPSTPLRPERGQNPRCSSRALGTGAQRRTHP